MHKLQPFTFFSSSNCIYLNQLQISQPITYTSTNCKYLNLLHIPDPITSTSTDCIYPIQLHQPKPIAKTSTNCINLNQIHKLQPITYTLINYIKFNQLHILQLIAYNSTNYSCWHSWLNRISSLSYPSTFELWSLNLLYLLRLRFCMVSCGCASVSFGRNRSLIKIIK